MEYWELAKEELGTDAVTFTLLYEDSESASNVAAFIQSEIETTLPRDGRDAKRAQESAH